MIQMRCPKCGDPVGFTATQAAVTCGRCHTTLQIDGPPPPAAPRKDRDQEDAISSAMKSLGLVIAVVFALPIVIGLWRGQVEGEGRCQIRSDPPGAKVFEQQTLLGETPLEIAPYYKEARTLTLRHPTGEAQLSLPANASQCDQEVSLSAPPVSGR